MLRYGSTPPAGRAATPATLWLSSATANEGLDPVDYSAAPLERLAATLEAMPILYYITSVVMPEDGTIHFAEDIYGHDTKLDRALTRRRLAQ